MENFQKANGTAKEVASIFAEANEQIKGGARGEQNEQAAKAAAVSGDGVKVSILRSEKRMIETAAAVSKKLAANLFAKNFAEILREKKREIFSVFFAEKKALENLGGKNAEIFKATCKDVFSGLYDKIDAETFKACRADAIESYKERLNAEKMAKQAAKVEGAISAAVAAAGLSEEQAAALMAAGLLKF